MNPFVPFQFCLPQRSVTVQFTRLQYLNISQTGEQGYSGVQLCNKQNEQECIPVVWVPPTSMGNSTGEGEVYTPPDQESPLPHKIQRQTHPLAPLHVGIHPPVHCMLRYTPSPVNRMTDGCKNITLLQTSFAGGKYFIRGSSRRKIGQISLECCHTNKIFVRSSRLVAVAQPVLSGTTRNQMESLFIHFSPVRHLNSSVSSSSFISMATVTIGELGGVIEQLFCCMALRSSKITQ